MPHFNPQACNPLCCGNVSFSSDDCNLYWVVDVPDEALAFINFSAVIEILVNEELDQWNQVRLILKKDKEGVIRFARAGKYRLRVLSNLNYPFSVIDFEPQEDCCGQSTQAITCKEIMGKDFFLGPLPPAIEKRSMFLRVNGFPFGWLNGLYQLFDITSFSGGNRGFLGNRAFLEPNFADYHNCTPGQPDISCPYRKLEGAGTPSWWPVGFIRADPDFSGWGDIPCPSGDRLRVYTYDPEPTNINSFPWDFGTYDVGSIAVKIRGLEVWLGIVGSNSPDFLSDRCFTWAYISIRFTLVTKIVETTPTRSTAKLVNGSFSVLGGLENAALNSQYFSWFEPLECGDLVTVDLSDTQSRIINSIPYQRFASCFQ